MFGDVVGGGRSSGMWWWWWWWWSVINSSKLELHHRHRSIHKESVREFEILRVWVVLESMEDVTMSTGVGTIK